MISCALNLSCALNPILGLIHLFNNLITHILFFSTPPPKAWLLMLCLHLLFPVTSDLSAQSESADSSFLAASVQAFQQRTDSLYDHFVDPCLVKSRLTVKTIPFQSFTLVNIVGSSAGRRVYVDDLYGNRAYSNILDDENIVIKVNNTNEYKVWLADLCGNEVVQAEFSTMQRQATDPLRVDDYEYSTITAWQRSGLPLNVLLQNADGLTDFEKLKVFQNMSVSGLPLEDKYADLTLLPQLLSTPMNEKSSDEGCCCSLVSSDNAYNASPTGGLLPWGYIDGRVVDPETFSFDNNRQNMDAWGWFKGPARFQTMEGRGSRRSGVAEVSWGQGGLDADEIDFDRIDIRQPEASQIDLNFMATTRWNWVCRNSFGTTNLSEECPSCERIVNFEWDYISNVSASARLISGARNQARGLALDLVNVLFFEDFDREGTEEVLQTQLNAVERECNAGEWRGITFTDVAAFYTDHLRLGLEILPLAVIGPGAGIDTLSNLDGDAIADIYESSANRIDRLLSEDWRPRSSCGAELGNMRRLNTRVGEPSQLQVRLQPNNPITVSMACGSILQVGGRKRYNAKATVSSAYRLASMMQGGGNPTLNVRDNCCSPWVRSWLIDYAIDLSVSAGSVDDLMNEVTSFFAVNGQPNQTNSHHGWAMDEQGYSCPEPRDEDRVTINGIVVARQQFDATYSVQTTSNGIIISKRDVETEQSHPSGFALYNMAGAQVRFRKNNAVSNSSWFISTNSLPSGIYLLAADNHDEILTKKIIVP